MHWADGTMGKPQASTSGVSKQNGLKNPFGKKCKLLSLLIISQPFTTPNIFLSA